MTSRRKPGCVPIFKIPLEISKKDLEPRFRTPTKLPPKSLTISMKGSILVLVPGGNRIVAFGRLVSGFVGWLICFSAAG